MSRVGWQGRALRTRKVVCEFSKGSKLLSPLRNRRGPADAVCARHWWAVWDVGLRIPCLLSLSYSLIVSPSIMMFSISLVSLLTLGIMHGHTHTPSPFWSLTLCCNDLFTYFLPLNCEISKEIIMTHIFLPNMSQSTGTWKNILHVLSSHPFDFHLLLCSFTRDFCSLS